MKKTVLSLATIAAASFLSMAADCSGTNIVACAADTDCADGEVCGIADGETEGSCLTPQCADVADCDLANSASPSTATECAADADCDAAGGEVCVADGVGTTYCVLANSDAAGESCVELDFVSVTVDGKDVCVVSSGQACDAATATCIAE
jgi:hypothetical protein